MKNTVIFLFLVFTFTNSFSQFYTGNTSALKDVFFNHKFNTITKGLANFNYSNNAKYFKFQRNSFENMVINYDQNLSPGRVIRSFAFLIHSPKLTASFGEKVQVNVLASFFNSWYAYIIYGIIILLFYIFYRKREQKILLIQRKALLLRQ